MRANQLYLFSLGDITFPNPAPWEPKTVPVTSYLIRSSRGKNILIDTGNPRALLGKETCAPWAGRYGVSMREEDDIVVQLAKVGLRPKDIDLLISSHFHFDHCGRHDVFAEANVPVVVQRAHYEAAIAQPDVYDVNLFHFDGWKYELVDGEVEVDRGVVLIETSGHAIGHQSVHVETANGNVVLAIDAISWPSLAQTREFPDWYASAEETNASVDKLMAWALEYRSYLIYGHDPEQWASLPHAPRAYSR